MGPWSITPLDDGPYPTVSVKRNVSDSPEVIIVGYGGASLLVERALARLEEEEIVAEGVFPSVLSPMRLDPVVSRISSVGSAVVVEEGIQSFGWGNHVVAETFKAAGARAMKIEQVGAHATVIPSASALERQTLPTLDRIISAVWTVMQ